MSEIFNELASLSSSISCPSKHNMDFISQLPEWPLLKTHVLPPTMRFLHDKVVEC